MPSYQSRAPQSILTDPFGERRRSPLFETRLLGGRFEFESGSPALRDIVEWTYSGLPQHRSSPGAPRLRVTLGLDAEDEGARRVPAGPPPIRMLSGGRLLAAGMRSSSFAAMAPDCRSAIIDVSREVLRFRYNVRYELLELAVYTLAARSLGLVPLHAGCVSLRNRGLLVVGESGAGKSTLTLQCSLVGLEFLSEDSLLVAPSTLAATGVPNFAHLRGDALRFFPPAVASVLRQSPKIRRRGGVTKIEIDLRRSIFKLAVPPVELVGTVFLRPERASLGLTLLPLSGRDIANRLRATQPYGVGQPGWRLFSRLLSQRPGFELRRAAQPVEAARLLKSLLEARNLRSEAASLA